VNEVQAETHLLKHSTFHAGDRRWGLFFSPLVLKPQHLTPAKINTQGCDNCFLRF
jgi:hypothetical protein